MNDAAKRIGSALADRYRFERPLGQGGMADVYLARDLRNDRDVAIKLMRPEVAAQHGVERFRREIRLIARLQHPFLLPLLDSGEVEGAFYYAMPYAPEGSLRARLDREGELPRPDAIRLLREIASALEYAHAQGVVHRDLKPENVLFSGGHAQLADFGVARVLEGAGEGTALTTAGVSLGTPQYMAPEQASGDPRTDHRADLYAFGVLAYEVLSGSAPFTAPTPAQVIAMHLGTEPEPLARRRPAVPAALASLVMRCLQKRPADRWQSASDLLAVLDRIPVVDSGDEPPAPGAGTVCSKFKITESLARKIDRERFDPRMIGDSFEYLDNQVDSDVMVFLLNAVWLDRSDFEPHLRLLPYRVIVPDFYGMGAQAALRPALSIHDHMQVLAALLAARRDAVRPSTVIVSGFSASADVALQMARVMAERGQPVDGVLALGPNQSIETCYISGILAELEDNDPARLLHALKKIASVSSTLDGWVVLNGYLGRIVSKFRSDLSPLQGVARDIVEPFRRDNDGAFAAMYREATAHARRVRCTFEGSETCTRLLRTALVQHMDAGVLGEHHREGSLVLESTPLHLEIAKVERVAKQLADLVEELRAEKG